MSMKQASTAKRPRAHQTKTLRQEIETWVTALGYYDNNEFEQAIRAFQPIVETAKIQFNCGVICATLGDHELAIDYYKRAEAYDQYFAVAYFQEGVSHFLSGAFEEALCNFNDALMYLRGNKYIDYEQLGLKYKLYSCEVIFNRGLSYLYLQQDNDGMTDLRAAASEKMTPDHDVIDEAIAEQGKDFTVFSINVGNVFRPDPAKVKNIGTRDYLGKPRLVATAQDPAYAQHRRQVSTDMWARDDRPADQISAAATNLVKQNLSSRSRQQSEPPINRHMFPPTPPPETDKPSAPLLKTSVQQRRLSPERAAGRGRSVSTRRQAPEPLELGIAAFDRTKHHQQSHSQSHASQTQQAQASVQASGTMQSRLGTTRSMSERPADRYVNRGSLDAQNGRQKRNTREAMFGAVDEEGEQEDVGARMLQQQHQHQVRQQQSRHHARNSTKGSNFVRSPLQNRPDFISEEDEDNATGADVRSLASDLAMRASLGTFPEVRDDRQARGQPSTTSGKVSGMQKVRVKVHFQDDTRYVIVAPGITFHEFEMHIAKKFGLPGSGSFKIKLRDEDGDLITMGDGDDLDMAMDSCKHIAAKEGADMGKLEVWVA